MARVVSKSIAIIGEGETEWFYFDSLRVACRFPFKVAPDFPQHSGGPVDVAVVSKGDGFIWMKRKHYFDPQLNSCFFENYFENNK